MELVKLLPVESVWTVVDGDSDQWIIPGIHTVNRICYLVTEVPHNWQEIEFRIPARGYSLTPLGLKRQVNQLEKFVVMQNRQQTASDFGVKTGSGNSAGAP